MTTEKAMEEAKRRRESEKDGSTEFWNTVIRTLGEWQRHSEEIYKRAYELGKRDGYDQGWQRGHQHSMRKR